jgi:putative ATP-dependent endonuclease of OLD family
LQTKYPNPKDDRINALFDYFSWSKGNWGIAEFLSQCSEDEIPEWIKETCKELRALCEQSQGEESEAEEVDEDIEDLV